MRAIEAELAGAVRVIALGSAPPPVVVSLTGPDPFADLGATDTPVAYARESPTPTLRVWVIALGAVIAVGALIWFAAQKFGTKPTTPDAARKPGDEPGKKDDGKQTLPTKVAGDEREAARKLLEHVELVRVRFESGEEDVRAGEALRNEPFFVTRIVINSDRRKEKRPANFVPAILLPEVERLAWLTHIEDDFGTTQWPEAATLRLAKAPCRAELIELRVPIELTPNTLKALKSFKKLKALTLRAGPDAGDALERLPELRVSLDILGIECTDKTRPFTEADWRGITGAPRTWLGLRGLRGADESAGKLVAKTPNLSRLGFGDCELGENFLREIGKCPGLIRLDFDDCTLPTDGLNHLARLETLEHLTFRGVTIPADSLATIAKMSSLRHLELYGTTGLNMEQVKELAGSLPRCQVVLDGEVIGPPRK
jgi:hypothetical protein